MNEMIEYIWDKPKTTILKKKNGDDVVKVNDNRSRKGVMVAFIPEGGSTVAIGVSLCCGIDKFDYKDGKKVKGFGLSIARERAKKHVDTDWIKVHGVTSIPQELRDKGDEEGIWIQEVKLPASVIDNLTNFTDRCRRYYQDVGLPTWAELLSNADVMTPIRSQIQTNQMLETDYFSSIGCELCCDPNCNGCTDF